MYDFGYQLPGSVDEAVKLLGADPEAKPLAGGQTLIPVLKQRLNRPSKIVDLAKTGLAGIKADANTVTIGSMTTHAAVANSADVRNRIPGAGRACRADRRRAGAPSRHDRRQPRQQRPGGGLPGRGAGPRRDDPHQLARHPGGGVFPGHVHDRPGARRDHHGGRVSGPREGGLREVPQPRVALRDRRRLRGQDERGRAGRRDGRRAERRVPPHGDGAGFGVEPVARYDRRGQHAVGRSEQRHPRQRRVPRAPGRRGGEAGAWRKCADPGLVRASGPFDRREPIARPGRLGGLPRGRRTGRSTMPWTTRAISGLGRSGRPMPDAVRRELQAPLPRAPRGAGRRLRRLPHAYPALCDRQCASALHGLGAWGRQPGWDRRRDARGRPQRQLGRARSRADRGGAAGRALDGRPVRHAGHGGRAAGHGHLGRQPHRRPDRPRSGRRSERAASGASAGRGSSPMPPPTRMAAWPGRWTWPVSAPTRCGWFRPMRRGACRRLLSAKPCGATATPDSGPFSSSERRAA